MEDAVNTDKPIVGQDHNQKSDAPISEGLAMWVMTGINPWFDR
jgi:hypothetical protein